MPEFERPWPGWIDGTIRPYVTSFAYLLSGFTAFHRLGNFDKLPVARRVFGQDTIDRAIERIGGVLCTWGYRVGRPHADRLPTVICQALLLVFQRRQQLVQRTRGLQLTQIAGIRR